MRKNPVVSLINLAGLAIGITCCLLILVYILDELSYDKYNNNAEQVYRVERTFLNPDQKSISLELGAIAPPAADLLKHDFKEIKAVTSLLPGSTLTMQYGDQVFTERDVFFADDQLFKIFDLFTSTFLSALKDSASL